MRWEGTAPPAAPSGFSSGPPSDPAAAQTSPKSVGLYPERRRRVVNRPKGWYENGAVRLAGAGKSSMTDSPYSAGANRPIVTLRVSARTMSLELA
jgi:hypothetical protein